MTFRALIIAVVLPVAVVSILHDHPTIMYHTAQVADTVLSFVR